MNPIFMASAIRIRKNGRGTSNGLKGLMKVTGGILFGMMFVLILIYYS